MKTSIIFWSEIELIMSNIFMQTPTEFIQDWLTKVSSNDAEAVVLLYKEEAVLLGTMDAEIRKGKRKIREYFDYFVTLRPRGKITYIIYEEVSDGAVAISNGTYIFELYEGDKLATVSARFTFVLEKAGTKWEILSHHSSKTP